MTRKYVSQMKCSLCNSQHNTFSAVQQHIIDKQDDKHTNTTINNNITPIASPVNSKLFQALYVINKQAKQYSNKSKQQYKAGAKASAKELSQRKEALYTAKEILLQNIQPHAEEIRKHRINDTTFYCLYFKCNYEKEWSYHVPAHSFTTHPTISVPENTQDLENFTKSTEITQTNMSFKTAAQYLDTVHHTNLNNYIPQQHNQYYNPHHQPTNPQWNFI